MPMADLLPAEKVAHFKKRERKQRALARRKKRAMARASQRANR